MLGALWARMEVSHIESRLSIREALGAGKCRERLSYHRISIASPKE